MLGGEPVRRARRPRASQHDRDLNERLRQVCQQILDRLAWAENTTINPADWPDLTPAALDRLRAHAAEQRRLAALDRAAVSSLLTDLRAPSSTAAGPNVAPPPTTVAGPRPRTVWPPTKTAAAPSRTATIQPATAVKPRQNASKPTRATSSPPSGQRPGLTIP